MDLASHKSDTNYPTVDCPYPCKCGPVSNIFLSYLPSHGHNRKPWMSMVGGVSTFWLLIYMCICPHLQVITNSPTPHINLTSIYWQELHNTQSAISLFYENGISQRIKLLNRMHHTPGILDEVMWISKKKFFHKFYCIQGKKKIKLSNRVHHTADILIR